MLLCAYYSCVCVHLFVRSLVPYVRLFSSIHIFSWFAFLFSTHALEASHHANAPQKAALHFKLLMFSLFVHTHIDMHISWHFCQLKLRGRCFFLLMFRCLSSSPSFPSTIIELYWWLENHHKCESSCILCHFQSNLNYSAAAAVVFVFHHFFLSFNSKIQSVVLISFKCKCLNFQWQCSLFTIKINDLNSHPIDDIARDKRHRWIKQTNQSGQLRAMRAN